MKYAWIPFLWLFILHRPALLSFGKAIPGSEQGDTIRGYWSAWLIAQDPTPLDTIMCNWPSGGHLLPLPPISLLLLSPLTLLLGAAYSLSILVYLHGLLCVVGGYALGRVLNCDRHISLGLGLLLSATPMLGETLSSGVFEYLTLGWMPLFFASLIHTSRGNPIFGPISALLYIIISLESGYYGSAAALGAIIIALVHIRSGKGLLSMIGAALCVGLLAFGTYQHIEPALSKLSSGELQAGGDFRVIMGTAELLALLPGIEPPPPPPGMPSPFVSAPPLFMWILFLFAAIYSFRNTYWSTFTAILFLGIATQSPLLDWWNNGPLGSFVQNLRRFAAPMTLMMLVSIAVAWNHWNKTKEKKHTYIQGIVFTFLLISSAQDLLLRYPLLWTPKVPLFAQTIQQDTQEGAVLVYPTEREGKPSTSHQYLRKNTSFSNPQARLWIQTLINRPMFHYTKLATMIPKEGRRWKFDGGMLSSIEIDQLKQQGLRYVILDSAQLSTQQQQQSKGIFSQKGYGCTHFDEWGGIDLCLLEQR